MGFRDTDDHSSFSRHGMGPDAGDVRYTRHHWRHEQDHGQAYGYARHQPPAIHGQRDPNDPQWREELLQALDEDYDAWRKERYAKFLGEFNQ